MEQVFLRKTKIVQIVITFAVVIEQWLLSKIPKPIIEINLITDERNLIR